MFIDDILAGMVIVISLLLLVVALIAYRRYRIKAMLVNSFIFILFLINAIIYSLNSLFSFHLDMVFYFLLFDTVILFSLYFAIALKG